jgi:hypothetical protein
MYYLPGDLTKELHAGRDKFFAVLKEADLPVKKKISDIRTTNSCHRFHVYKNSCQRQR